MGKRIEFANSLRGVAALFVLISHYANLFWLNRSIVPLITGLPEIPASVPTPMFGVFLQFIQPVSLGPAGVAVFFLISGFVIPFAFQTQTRVQFAIGRFFRILPAYFVGFLLGAAVLAVAMWLFGRPFLYSVSAVAVHTIAGLRAILQTPMIDFIVWTLEIELAFYIIAILIAPFLKSGSWLTYTAPACIFAVSLLFGETRQIHFAPAGYLTYMFIGVSLNFYFRRCQTLPVTVLSIVLLLPLAASYLPDALRIRLTPSYAFALVLFLAAMLMDSRMPHGRVLRFFAAISYPLYATHVLFGYALMTLLVLKAGFGLGSAFVIAVLLIIPIAFAIHVLVETPAHGMGKRIGERYAGAMDAVRRALVQKVLRNDLHG